MGLGKRVEIETGAILAGALALLILPLSVCFSFVLAGFIHECCHYLALRGTGVKIYKIRIGPCGTTMETEAMEPGREVLCALAGPLGSFLLIACYKITPMSAIFALVQGSFNLLPVYPLDGGRAVNGILEILKIPGREKIASGIGWISVLIIIALCIYGFFKWNLGYGVLILGTVLVLRALPRKTPCKEGFFGVQ